MNARRALAFVFCTVTLDALAIGLMMPVLPRIVLGFLDGDTARAAEVFGIFATAWGLMQFLCSPLQGALSDRFGRRPVLLISCMGLGLDYVFMAVAPSLTLLLIGRIISGITAATVSTAYAYITDVTVADGRAEAFGIVGMAFGLAFVLGPAAGGLLAEVDPRLPFWLSAAACFANTAFGWFVLPESLPPERRMAFSWKHANPIGSLNLLRSHRELLGLAVADFLTSVAHQVLPSILVLYTAYRYGWGNVTVGLMLAFVGICSAASQGLAIGPTVAKLGTRWALVVAQILGSLGMAAYGLASTGLLFCAAIPLLGLWGMASPSIQELMSRHVGESEQGRLQGANSSSRSIAGLVAPGLFAWLFSSMLGWMPGAPFYVASALLALAAAVAWRATTS